MSARHQELLRELTGEWAQDGLCRVKAHVILRSKARSICALFAWLESTFIALCVICGPASY